MRSAPPNRRVDGGRQSKRGDAHEVGALALYALRRFQTHPDLVVHLQPDEPHPGAGLDACLLYGDGGVVEIVECKKREGGTDSRPSRGVTAADGWEVGRFKRHDLLSWLPPALRDGLDSDPALRITFLLAGTGLDTLTPVRLRETAVLGVQDPETFEAAFPPAYLHDPAPSVLNIPAPVGARVRTVPTTPPFGVRAEIAQVLLAPPYEVPAELGGPAAGAVLELFDLGGSGHAPDRRIDRARLERVIERYRGGHPGRWRPIDPGAAGTRAGDGDWPEHPDAEDVAAGRIVRLPLVDAVREAAAEGRPVVVCGARGSGRRTAARAAAYDFLAGGPGRRAYRLRLTPGESFAEERSFLLASVARPYLFVVEDEEMNPEATEGLAAAFDGRNPNGHLPSRLLVVSTRRFSNTQIHTTDGAASTLHAFRVVGEGPRVRLGPLLEAYAAAAGIELPLAAGALADLAGGRIGMARHLHLVARGVEGAPRRGESLRAWLDLHVPPFLERLLGPDPPSHAEEVVPLLALARHRLPVPAGFSRAVPPLLDAGLLERDAAGTLLASDFLVSIADRITLPELARDAAVLRYLEHAAAAPRLAVAYFATAPVHGRPLLQDLLRNRRPPVLDLLDRIPPVGAEFARVLGKLQGVNAAFARRHLREAHTHPGGAPARRFFRNLLAGAADAAEAAEVLEQALRVDRPGMRGLLEHEAAGRGTDRIAEAVEALARRAAPASPGSAVARLLRALVRCSRRTGMAVHDHLRTSGAMDAVIGAMDARADRLPEHLEFATALFPVDRHGSHAHLERYFTRERLEAHVRQVEPEPFSRMLYRMRRVHPALARRLTEELLERARPAVAAALRAQTRVEALANALYGIGRLSYGHGIQLAYDLEGTLVRGMEAAHYRLVGSTLDTLGRISSRLASRLAATLSADRLAAAIREDPRPEYAGRFLRTLATVAPGTARTVHAQLPWETFRARLPRAGFRALAQLVHGYVAAAPPDRRADTIGTLQDDPELRRAFRGSLGPRAAVFDLAGGLARLLDVPLSRDDLCDLLDFPTPGEMDGAWRARLVEVATLGEAAALLYAVGRCALPVATEVAESWEGEEAPDWLAQAARVPERNVHDVAYFLRAAGAVSPTTAARLAGRFFEKDIFEGALAEGHAGRVVHLLEALARASHRGALRLVKRLSEPALVETLVTEAESSDAIRRLAIQIGRLSIAHGARFRDALADAWAPVVADWIEEEERLDGLAEWIRILSLARGGRVEALRHAAARRAVARVEAEGRLSPLVHAAMALGQAGRVADAEALRGPIEAALPQAGALEPEPVVDALFRLEAVDRASGGPPLAPRLVEALSWDRWAELLTRTNPILGSFLYWLLTTGERFPPLPPALDLHVRDLLDARREAEPCPALAAVVSLFRGHAPGAKDMVFADGTPVPLWVCGLAAHLAATVQPDRPGLPAALARLPADEAEDLESWLPDELGPHTPGVTFALALHALRAGGAPEAAYRAHAEVAARRAEDEPSPDLRHLLLGTAGPPTRHRVWRILRDTLLHASVLSLQPMPFPRMLDDHADFAIYGRRG